MPKNNKKVPDRWLDYTAMGSVIPGTRFFACKVPLQEGLLTNVPEHERFTPLDLLKAFPNIGLLVDLTNTNRYYSKQDIVEKRIRYEKICCPGHVVPPNSIVRRFVKVVDEFLKARSADCDSVIAVHCTHGVNRTGYFICRYMIENLKVAPEEAIQNFHLARGHKIERQNYIDDLKNGCKGGSNYNLHLVNSRSMWGERKGNRFSQKYHDESTPYGFNRRNQPRMFGYNNSSPDNCRPFYTDRARDQSMNGYGRDQSRRQDGINNVPNTCLNWRNPPGQLDHPPTNFMRQPNHQPSRNLKFDQNRFPNGLINVHNNSPRDQSMNGYGSSDQSRRQDGMNNVPNAYLSWRNPPGQLNHPSTNVMWQQNVQQSRNLEFNQYNFPNGLLNVQNNSPRHLNEKGELQSSPSNYTQRPANYQSSRQQLNSFDCGTQNLNNSPLMSRDTPHSYPPNHQFSSGPRSDTNFYKEQSVSSTTKQFRRKPCKKNLAGATNNEYPLTSGQRLQNPVSHCPPKAFPKPST